MRVTFDPDFLAAAGLTEAETAIDLPDDFGSYSPAQRKAWARRQIEGIAMEMFQDLATGHGIEPTAAQRAAYLADIQPGIDEAMARDAR